MSGLGSPLVGRRKALKLQTGRSAQRSPRPRVGSTGSTARHPPLISLPNLVMQLDKQWVIVPSWIRLISLRNLEFQGSHFDRIAHPFTPKGLRAGKDERCRSGTRWDAL